LLFKNLTNFVAPNLNGFRTLITRRMANHKSSEKRIRQEEVKKADNKYHARTTRNAIKTLRSTTIKEEAVELLPKVSSMLDKLAKRNDIHKKKASNLKSSLTKHVNSL
jgi:small subunit ribosomal protein S20